MEFNKMNKKNKYKYIILAGGNFSPNNLTYNTTTAVNDLLKRLIYGNL